MFNLAVGLEDGVVQEGLVFVELNAFRHKPNAVTKNKRFGAVRDQDFLELVLRD